jgi:hypothetical protein
MTLFFPLPFGDSLKSLARNQNDGTGKRASVLQRDVS